MGVSDAAKKAIHLIGFLKDLGFSKIARVELFNDNQGAAKLSKNPVFHSRTKHVDVKHHFIRQALRIYPINLCYLATERMVADILTKALTGSKHHFCVTGLGLS